MLSSNLSSQPNEGCDLAVLSDGDGTNGCARNAELMIKSSFIATQILMIYRQFSSLERKAARQEDLDLVDFAIMASVACSSAAVDWFRLRLC